jgi:hypothetical protein
MSLAHISTEMTLLVGFLTVFLIIHVVITDMDTLLGLLFRKVLTKRVQLYCWKSGFDSHTCLGVALQSISSLARPSLRVLAAAELAFHVFQPPVGGCCCEALTPLRFGGPISSLAPIFFFTPPSLCEGLNKTSEGMSTHGTKMTVKLYIFFYAI